MNIGIDAKPLEKHKAGIGIYLEQIIKNLNDIDKENTYYLYTPREFKVSFKLNDNFIVKQKKTGKIGELFFFLNMHKMIKKDNIDVFWGTEHILPKKTKNTQNIKYVLTVHDLAIKKLKNVGSLKNTITQKIFLKRSIKSADKIIAISEATKQDVIELFNIKEDKIDVVYNGTNFEKDYKLSEDEIKKVEKRINLGGAPYLLFVSTIEPRKNVETLIRAFNYIKEKENTNLKLVIAGRLGWKYGKVIELFDESPYKEDIIMPGYIEKEEKKYLYQNTKCFIYPSLYEGFGLPILEAMSNKALVITANNSSLPEVGGKAAFYYESILDYKELGDKIISVMNLEEEEKEKRINEGLKQIEKFTWDKCAKEVLEILQ